MHFNLSAFGRPTIKTITKTFAQTFTLTLILMFTAAPAFGAQKRIPPDEEVVTPARISEQEGATTSSVTVIRRAELLSMGVVFLDDALRRLGILSMQRQGGQGAGAYASLRGLNSDHIVVLMDGIKLNDPMTGRTDLSGMLIEDIERIEIARGPHNVSYGSRSEGGVVNIITQKGTSAGSMTIMLSYGVGAEGTVTPSATIMGGKKYRYRLSASKWETDGVSSSAWGTEPDGHELKSYFGYLFMPAYKTGVVEIMTMKSETDSDLDRDPAVGPNDDIDFTQSRERNLLYTRLTDYSMKNYVQTLTVSQWEQDVLKQDSTYAIFNAGTSAYDYSQPYDMNSIGRVRAAEYQGNVYEEGGSVGIIGTEFREETAILNGTGSYYEQSFETLTAYVNLKTVDGPHTFIFGARQDQHEEYGDHTSYRVSAVQVLEDEGVKYRASYGTGINFPTVQQYVASLAGIPLSVEQSKGWEIGYEKGASKTGAFELVYFDLDIIDMIEPAPGTGLPENIAEADIKGVEFRYYKQPGKSFGYNFAYTWLDAKDGVTGKALPLRPEDRIDLTLDYRSSGFTLRMDASYVGSRPDPVLGIDMAPYNIVHLGGTYKMGKTFSLYGRLDNALDEQYSDRRGFTATGREYFVGMKAIF